MYRGRNVAQGLAKKGILKLVYLGSQYVSDGRGVRDFMSAEPDSATLVSAGKAEMRESVDPKSLDGTLNVDKLTGVYLSKTAHREDQPVITSYSIHYTKLYENWFSVFCFFWPVRFLPPCRSWHWASSWLLFRPSCSSCCP